MITSTKEWINIERVRRSFSGFKDKKSPGPDRLSPIIFKHLPNRIVNHLVYIYSACVLLQFTPTLWKNTKVVFIPKPGKSDYSEPKSFRPISLSNYLLKTLERLCCWRMEEAISMDPLHTRQHGFRADRSTETAISDMTNYIEKYLFNKRHCVGIFLDISSAFDTISPKHIRETLLKKGGDPIMV